MRNSCGVRVTSHEAIDDTEASYMAWIVPIPPSARHPQERYQVCFQDGKRHRSAGIFPPTPQAPPAERAKDPGRIRPRLLCYSLAFGGGGAPGYGDVGGPPGYPALDPARAGLCLGRVSAERCR